MATTKMIEPHLREWRHITKDGTESIRYFAVFTAWNRRAINKPLGDNFKKAQAKLEQLLNRNKVANPDTPIETDDEWKERIDKERREKEKELERKGVTFREWAEKYFAEVVPKSNGVDCETMDGVKRISTVHGQKLRMKTLNEFFGDVALCDIGPELIKEYRKARSAKVSSSTVNRSLSLLGYLLNLAADPDHAVLDAVPKIKKQDENDRPEQRSVDEDEYQKILAGMGREQQRVVIAWHETSMRHQEALDLKWSMVILRRGC
jgi:integrase